MAHRDMALDPSCPSWIDTIRLLLVVFGTQAATFWRDLSFVIGRFTSPRRDEHREKMREVLSVPALLVIASVANAQGAPPDQQGFEGWSPVPPIEQSAIGSYCIHRNLLYSIGAVLCAGSQGLVCAPSAGTGTGGRAYWSSVPVSRGDINWAPPAHYGR